ncbi:cyclic nucleotide-binding domain-containing protein [Dechloromonas sp. ZY10]|uniref:cyclic nucleotide-binding domain-containing protein n=1 Tax=Dechloromonas aquae TaxID=2664436 RepID=UPI00352854E4
MNLTVELLQRLEPVRGLSAARLSELVQWCRLENCAAGGDPLRQAGDAMRFVYLLAGELKIVLPDGTIKVIVGGCEIARWPLGYKTSMPVSARAITDAQILRLDFDLLDIMMTWDELASVAEQKDGQEDDPPPWTTMTGAFSAQSLVSGALAQLPPAHIHELLGAFERIFVRAGQYIIREGEHGDFYYLLESGRCTVLRQVGGGEVGLAELRAGDAFGEEALVSDAPRNASVKMRTDGVLLRLSKPDFIRLLKAPLLQEVSPHEAELRVASGRARWLDVRYPAEFAQDGLPGAVNVPLNEIRTAFSLLDPEVEYITYCHSGRRSAAAAFLLARNGFKACRLNDGAGKEVKS